MKSHDNVKLLSIKKVLMGELLSFICLSIGTIFLAFFYMDKITFAVFILAHIILVILLIILNLFLFFKNIEMKLFTFIAVEVAVAGPMGGIISAFAILFYYYFMTTRRRENNSVYELIHPVYELSEPQKVYNQVVYYQDSLSASADTEPMGDIIHYGTTQEKLAVLIKINKYFYPEFTQILFEAVNDSDNSVRVQAAAIIANIEKKLLEKLKLFESKIGDNEFNTSDLEKFLDFEEKYSKTGLLHIDRYNAVIENWVNTCSIKCFENNINNVSVRLIIARVYLLMGKPYGAFLLLRQCADTDEKLSGNFIEIFTKILFILKHYGLLRDFCKAHSENILKEDCYEFENLYEILKTWAI